MNFDTTFVYCWLYAPARFIGFIESVEGVGIVGHRILWNIITGCQPERFAGWQAPHYACIWMSFKYWLQVGNLQCLKAVTKLCRRAWVFDKFR